MSEWPYDPSALPGSMLPYSPGVSSASVWYKAQLISIPPTIRSIRSSLDSGVPVLTGLGLTSSFFVPDSGRIPYDEIDTAEVCRHAVVVVGYDSNQDSVLVRNSWGESWGIQGHAWVQDVHLASMVIETGTLDGGTNK